MPDAPLHDWAAYDHAMACHASILTHFDPPPPPLPPASFPTPSLAHSAGSRISLAGSLDPATGIFYRSPEHPRLRTAQACEKCRTRKAKCSGEHPTCKRCQSRGLVCEYAKEGRVRGPNKPKKTAAQIRASEADDPQLSAAYRERRPRPPNLNLKQDTPTMEHYRLDGGFQLTPSSSNLGAHYDYEYEYDYGLAHQQLNALSHHHHQQQHGPRYRYAEQPGTGMPIVGTSTASVHTHPGLAYQGVHVHTPTASLSMDELGYSFHHHDENRSPSTSSSTSIQGAAYQHQHHPHLQSVGVGVGVHHHPHCGPSSPSILGVYRPTRESLTRSPTTADIVHYASAARPANGAAGFEVQSPVTGVHMEPMPVSMPLPVEHPWYPGVGQIDVEEAAVAVGMAHGLEAPGVGEGIGQMQPLYPIDLPMR